MEARSRSPDPLWRPLMRSADRRKLMNGNRFAHLTIPVIITGVPACDNVARRAIPLGQVPEELRVVTADRGRSKPFLAGHPQVSVQEAPARFTDTSDTKGVATPEALPRAFTGTRRRFAILGTRSEGDETGTLSPDERGESASLGATRTIP